MGRDRYCQGQALVEALVGGGALAVLFLLLANVHRVQDLGLRASHASRYFVLALTRRDPGLDIERETLQHFFDPRANRWVTRHGASMLEEAGRNVHVQRFTGQSLPEMQVGTGQADAIALRNELLFRDKGITTGRVELAPRLAPDGHGEPTGSDLLGLRAWDSLRLKVPRHTAILTEAGHGADDRAVTARIAQSDHAWRSAARRSEQVGRRVAASLQGPDAPWGRPAPDFNWLRAWEDVVPEDRLKSGGSAP